jgi:PIN domain nuclease of toxin-antitoxin system
VKLLLDTHVVIWWVMNDPRLPQRIDDQIISKSNEIHVSAATPWEIAIKVRTGKLVFDAGFLDDFDNRLAGLGFRTLVMTSAHGVAAARLPGMHKDPFDRMIGAQATLEQMALVSNDAAFKTLGIPAIW